MKFGRLHPDSKSSVKSINNVFTLPYERGQSLSFTGFNDLRIARYIFECTCWNLLKLVSR